ncbi:MAG: MinD/ParA family protein [Anaerolineae bacterium]|jgi:MinD-like ATPase involved in chromosome partitioning or flagellar assembly|nr:MinD/ParA family protein [Anaerolineae bacterium]MBT7072204.1 MinD/ParA family protein [Anaerolineae bacterium]MBT7324702.1 MinD/ParA family protein [Anaerolineae bacterium]
MSKIVSIHSFRGGTGKSNITANTAAMLAAEGKRVGVIDTDILSPGIHVLFGLKEEGIKYALNDYIWGRCKIEDTAYQVGQNGNLYLIPSSIQIGEITRILREGYDSALLNRGFQQLIEELALDILLIDTHPGVNEETLLSIAFSDTLIIILRPDQQDYQGTGVTVKVARKLEVPDSYKAVELAARLSETYQSEVAAVFHHSDELMTLGSGGLFVQKYPDHSLTQDFRQLAARLLA